MHAYMSLTVIYRPWICVYYADTTHSQMLDNAMNIIGINLFLEMIPKCIYNLVSLGVLLLVSFINSANGMCLMTIFQFNLHYYSNILYSIRFWLHWNTNEFNSHHWEGCRIPMYPFRCWSLQMESERRASEQLPASFKFPDRNSS